MPTFALFENKVRFFSFKVRGGTFQNKLHSSIFHDNYFVFDSTSVSQVLSAEFSRKSAEKIHSEQSVDPKKLTIKMKLSEFFFQPKKCLNGKYSKV